MITETRITRRGFALGAVALPFVARAAKIDSTVRGVRLGAITYTFRDLPRKAGEDNIDDIIGVLTRCGIGEIELFNANAEPGRAGGGPQPGERDALRQWRLRTPMSYFAAIRRKFDAAGIGLHAYTMNYRADFTDAEVDKTFEQARALGVDTIASSTQVSMARRLLGFADRHKINVAFHGHSEIEKADEFSTPATFQKALDLSPYAKVNLDIGHFTAANEDALDYIEKHHDRITHLHIKDRKRNNGANVEWGQGETPIGPVLRLLSEKKYAIPAFIEYEYRGAEGSEAEARKCMAFMRKALA